MDAVLRVGALLDAAGPHQRFEALALIHRARGVHIEEPHLADDGRAHKLIVFIHLRAYLEAASAADAVRQRIAFLLNFRRYARAFAEIVSAVNGNPRFHALQAFEHELAIDGELAHQGKFRERRDAVGPLELIHVSRAGHAGFAVDKHGARTANLLKAV